jgi:hypothetical protein
MFLRMFARTLDSCGPCQLPGVRYDSVAKVRSSRGVITGPAEIGPLLEKERGSFAHWHGEHLENGGSGFSLKICRLISW